MAAQTLFNRTVGFHLPSAIPTQLERIDEFEIGKVLVYTKKPKRFTPWRKHELSFTGWSISSLLSSQPEDPPLKIASASSFLFDLGKGSSSATVQVNLDAELNLREALLSLDATLKVDEQKKLSITSDFGKVTHVSTDLLTSCSSRKFQVNTDHPIVQEAMEKGGAMFVITSMYTAERCNIQVNISDNMDETLGAGAKPGGGGNETVKDSGTTTHVLSRNQATPIAYLLLRLVVGKHGEINPHLNTHLRNVKTEYEVLSKLGAFPKPPPSSKMVQLPQLQTQESQDFRDWIIIDIVEESGAAAGEAVAKVTEDSEASATKPQTIASSETGPQAPIEEVAMMKVSTDLGSVPPPPSNAQVNTPYATPMSEVQKSADAAAAAGGGHEGTDSPAIDQHYVYSLRDFQPFESATYQGILGEVEEWVEPLVSNSQLHSAYLNYIQPPRTLEKLRALTTFLLEYGNALRTHKPVPTNTNKDIDAIMTKLSKEVKVQLDEVTSLIVTSEALDEYPQFLVMKAIQLPSDKRQALVDVICQTPYGTDRHVYMDVGPYKDPDLYPFMAKMGFSLPSTEHHLIFTSGDDSEEDILAAGLIMLKATIPSPAS